MIVFQSVVRKLAEEIRLIASENPSHRIQIKGSQELELLAQSINQLAAHCEDIRTHLQEKIRHAKAESEQEKNVLAAFISELPQGILICNAEGQILLYNKRASRFFGMDEDISSHTQTETSSRSQAPAWERESSSPGVLGSSVFTVIDKHLIEHALDEINEKLKRNVMNVVSHFVVKLPENHVLQFQTIPILNQSGQFSGFILIFNDITHQQETDNRVDTLLQSLTKNARSPLASIRSAIEIMLEYPDMDRNQMQRFKEIIHKESVMLSNILNTVASDYASLVKTRRALIPIYGTELAETVRRRARDRLGLVVHIETPAEKLRFKADTYSLITLILFVLNQLKKETGTQEFTCKLEADEKFIHLDLGWQGKSIRAETVKKWEDRFLIIDQEKSPLILKEVLQHHGAEIWSHASAHDAYIRLLLPANDMAESDKEKPITVLPESTGGFYNFGYNFDLFSQPGQNPELDNRLLTELTYTVLIREIAETENVEDIMMKHSQLPGLIHRMIASGARIQNITWLITTCSDAILKKIVEFAIREMPPPPVRFAFITLGSEGRKEQTLKTDQDNAIIFEDTPDESAEAVNAYFLQLGENVCAWLDQAGYEFCKGNIMAKNPKWCQPLSVWKKYFSDWIHAAEPEDLLHSSIFFDFHMGYGDQHLVDELRKHLYDSLTGWTGFFRHMSENTVCFKPPLNFWGKFIVASDGKYRNCLDIKQAMTPLVDFARIYALKHNIRETNTQERLYQLYLKNALTREDYNEIEQAYSFMMQLRFVRQITGIIDEGAKPDNYINPKTLSAIERKMLKEVLKRTGKFQTRLSFEFIGESDLHMK